MAMSYDLSDLGGVKLTPNKYDLSDIGGRRVDGSEQKSQQPQKSIAQRFKENLTQLGSGQPEQPGAFAQGVNALWQTAPLAVGGELLGAGRAAAEGAPLVGQAARWLGGKALAPTLARGGLGGGALGAASNPDHPVMGAAGGAALGAGLGAAGAGFNALRPSNLFRGNLSPQELKNNLSAAEGTETPLGEVIGSPTLKHAYENFASRHFMSGADKKSANVAGAITGKANDIASKYLGDAVPEEVPSKIGEALSQASRAQQVEKNNLYNKAHALADKVGLKIEAPEFSNTVNKYSNLIGDQNFLKYEPDAKQLLQKLGNYKEGLEGAAPSLKESNMLAGRLNGLAKEYGASPTAEDRNMARVFGELGSSLKGDIKQSLEKSGSKDLQDEFKNAEENYKKNFVPFLDKDVYKFTHGGKNPQDILSTFLKTDKNTDKGAQLEKLMSKLSPENQNLVKYAYLSRAMKGAENNRSIDPNELSKLWGSEKLGQAQKKALFRDPAERAELDKFTHLTSMNKDALSRMFNPPTGNRALESLMHGMSGGVGASIGTAVGGVPGAVAGGLAGMGGTGLLARYLTNKLTNPQFRQSMVEAMLRRGQQ